MQLLRIEGRKAKLTEAGLALLERSRHLVKEAMELELFAHSLGEGWESEMHLVVDAAFPTALLMRILRDFEVHGHGIEVKLNEVGLAGAEKALQQAQADLAITPKVPAGFLGDPLIDVEYVAVAHPDHPLLRLHRELTITDLEREVPIVVRSTEYGNSDNLRCFGSERSWNVASLETAIAALREGLGYAWLPRHRVQGLLEEGVLTLLPLREGSTSKTTLYLIHGRARNPGPGVSRLADLLRAAASA